MSRRQITFAAGATEAGFCRSAEKRMKRRVGHSGVTILKFAKANTGREGTTSLRPPVLPEQIAILSRELAEARYEIATRDREAAFVRAPSRQPLRLRLR